MIKGIHGLLYSSDAEASRAFFRDKLQLPFTDIHDGWLIFDFAEGDLGVHPIDHGGSPGDHDVSFYCDDIKGTVASLASRGVEFTGPIADHGYGFVTHIKVPGGITVQLYEPKYAKATSAAKKASRPAAKRKVVKKVAKKKPALKKRKSKR